eukprot:TRINITY_DN2287_c0_g1_i1.p1 TRINITY_DN2287_c0_g1~~TRINITY_DN2287_c0_g1_i1.p1  ORF type:complete len:202 (-),score=87.69 TRINITY_DN2287_c0_g1_i1:395-940(-)
MSLLRSLCRISRPLCQKSVSRSVLFRTGLRCFSAEAAPGSHQPSEKITKLVDEIAALNLIEVNDLLGALRKKLGMPEGMGMPMMMAAPMAAAAPAAGGAAAAPAAEAKPAKTEFALKLVKFDAAAKIKVIKEVREITKLGLKEAKDLVEAAPKVLAKDLKKEEADKLIEKLKAAGAVVELE